MKKFITNIKTLAALLMAGAALTACSSSDDTINEIQQPANPTGKYTMTINASKGDDAQTRALLLDESGTKNVLNAIWDEGEEVLVYQNGSEIGTLTAAASDDAETTLSGTLDSAPDASKALTFYFHTAADPSYGGQDGTLTKIASTYDFCAPATVASGSFTVNTVTSTVTVPNGISFGANQQAIVKFTLKDKANNAISPSAISASLDVNSTAPAWIQTAITTAGITLPYESNITIPDATYTENGAGIIYLAIPDKLAGMDAFKEYFDFTLTATVGSYIYTLTKSGFPFSNGQYYEVTAKMGGPCVSGKFSVSSTKQVYFSKGNLRASKNIGPWSWSFAPNQLWYVGDASSNNQIDGDGSVSTLSDDLYVDLFGWSTTARHYGISNNTTNSSYSDIFVDWGSVDEVKDGIGTGWSSLKSTEWRYLFKTRTTTSGIRYTKASIDGAYGIILLPDDWSTDYYSLNSKYLNDDCAKIGFASCNVITTADWTSKLEAHGAVFLRAAGQREDRSITYANGRGYYWSCNEVNSESGIRLYFAGNEVSPDAGGGKHFGYSVRLVYRIGK